LPETVDYSNIEAAYEGGILILTVGKKEDAIIAKRLIEVK
jgi:HSP20 family protein